MRLTKQTGYAIRILTDIAANGSEMPKVASIAARLGITKQNVFKIVHLLSRAGFVTPVRGPSGGVRLARPASSIRIGDVVRATEVTDVEINGEAAALTNIVAAPSNPSINSVLDDALNAFVSVLDQHTLADLVVTRSTRATTARTAKVKAKEQVKVKSKPKTRRAKSPARNSPPALPIKT